MSRRDTALEFDAIHIEGGLLPAEWLANIAALKAAHQSPADYDIPKGLNLRDELGRYWRIAQAHWSEFAHAREQAEDRHALASHFVQALLREVFGAADLQVQPAPVEVSERQYPITASARDGRLPLVIAAADQRLDERDRRYGDSGRQRSAFGLLQDYLNATDAALWGIASNGSVLRLAHDNASLTRPAWIEADLARIFSEVRYADFSLLWLLIHATRFGNPGTLAAQCPLETWREASKEQGTRARDQLRQGVEEALLALGQGFLSEAANQPLRDALANGALDRNACFQQLLRLVYRLIFLLTIEERGLLHPADAYPDAIKLYADGYSLRRLRERARRRRAFDRHTDLWDGLKPVLTGLAQGQPLLALPALGGLFAQDQCPDLDACILGNAALLEAVAKLGWMRDGRSLTRINWRDMGPEELGSVYESLLELVPDISTDGRVFRFANADESRGNARKTSGSYYTPDSLVQELLDSALEPVIAQRIAGAADPQAALLSITVCDPACGSGHFLLGAARRLATRLAQLRAQGTPSGEDFRHALRDVVTHCIYGVDRNPMALELARMSLWLEAMTPDKPLGFLDHHLQCGDALLGVLDLGILDAGIPDDAFKALTGDDKALASELKNRNKAERTSWQSGLGSNHLFASEHLASATDAVEQLADDDLGAVAAKGAAWQAARESAEQSRLARLADLYVGAFLLPKTTANEDAIPRSRHLWAVAHGQSVSGLDDVEVAASAACNEARVFHWWLAFAHIHAAGGFSVMLGNPPWEVSQMGEEEFFAARSPEIASLAGAARKRAIAELERENPRLWNEYLDESQRVAACNAFYRGGRYPLTAFGKLNTYALFAETFTQLVSVRGRAGVIVPTGIATDDGNSAFFASITNNARLVALRDFENSEGVFPGVHRSYKFSLITLGHAEVAEFTCFATQVAQLADPRRHFTLTPDEFALLNPNTRTCPIFRSKQDAELTKAIYRRVPVLIRETVQDAEGNITVPEVNPWSIFFSQGLFNMTSDSGLFQSAPGADTLPLYEAKMIHQFDHRWASWATTPDGKLETVDCSDAQKADADFSVTPRYWVDRIEVLAKIARVPNGVSKAWLAAHKAADPAERAEAFGELWLALAQWIAGELFRREAGEPPASGYSEAQGKRGAHPVLARLSEEFPACTTALHAARFTSRKAETEFPKWAARDSDTPLTDTELASLRRHAAQAATDARDVALLAELDGWMDALSPLWLMGWRDICRSTDERTVIASVVPRKAVSNKMPLMMLPAALDVRHAAALLANLDSLTLDFVARQKIGGTTLNYFYIKQFPVLPPNRYTTADLAFIVPRVLELTYTAHDLADWARDLGHTGPPFAWNPERRAQLRAELDAIYARLYGLTRDELRYILDPADVMGDDYPSETFRVLKNNEQRAFGEYRTRRLVLEAWDRLASGSAGSDTGGMQPSITSFSEEPTS